jgi:hypothetical protein
MKKLLVTLAAVLISASAFAQGTIVFNNRNLTAPAGGTYNAPITGNTVGATAQLFLVTGAAGSETYTPLTPVNTFRAAPNNAFLTGPVQVEVPGQPPGTTGVRFVVRAWQGASYDTATERGQSAIITVTQPLGGTPTGAPPITPPDLGGAQGLQSFPVVPEPSTIALGLLGAAALLYRRRK